MSTEDELLALLQDVRVKHHPHFAALEAKMRARFPEKSELEVALGVIAVLDAIDADERETMEDSNPGLSLVQ